MPVRRVSTVPCPLCGYDLRGVAAVEDFYRCPECGGVSTLGAMARLRRSRERLLVRATLGLVVFAVLVAVYMFVRG